MATKPNTPKDENDIYHLIDGKCYVSFSAYAELQTRYCNVVIERNEMLIDQLSNERAQNRSSSIRSKPIPSNPHMRISCKRKA